MTPLLPRVRRTLRERRLLAAGDAVLVACSGGPDSVAMTHLLWLVGAELGLRLEVASVDHGLRPDAAADVAVAAGLADRLELPFHALRVEVEPGSSLQASARRARYRALLELARGRALSAVAVGHTLDDQAETVAFRVLRGAGVRGLSGIAPRRRDGVVRPLIDCRRSDVRAYVAHHRLEVCRDPSNEDPRFARARLRATVLPALEAEDPAAAAHLAALADDARALRALVEGRARRLLGCGEAPRVARLRAAPGPVRREALRRFVESRTGRRPSRAHIEALEAALGGRGRVRLPGGVEALVRDGGLWLQDATAVPTRSSPDRAGHGKLSRSRGDD